MKLKLYEAYGVLAHENRPVYSTIVPASDHYNIVEVNIPDEYEISRNTIGQLLIDLNGETYMLSEVLMSYGDRPALIWYDGQKKHRVVLNTKKLA